MKFKFLTLFFILQNFYTFSQGPIVPSQLDFADIRLKLSESARREIQSDVDALTRHPKYFQIKLDRVELYFPIIERIFKEEGIPDDFKYLVIQESALISDAVSSSNAVGYWQFKKESAEEVGLRIDGTVDERINLISSTRGAAKYLKRNNFYFDNWLYSLQSYNVGRGGTERSVDKKFYGARKMEIDKSTHWYIKKYLAHKIAFENEIKKSNNNSVKLVEYQDGANKTLKEIAEQFQLSHDEVVAYNKWLKRSHVPDDKVYTVVLPMPVSVTEDFIASRTQSDRHDRNDKLPEYKNESEQYPVVKTYRSGKSGLLKINGILGTRAVNQTDINALASAGGIKPEQFLSYNDMEKNQKIVVGQVYYLRRKKNKAKEHFHTVNWGENLWSVSQKYGIKVKALMRKNRMRKPEELKPGRVLWLRFIRPSSHPIEHKEINSPTINPTVARTDKAVIPSSKVVISTEDSFSAERSSTVPFSKSTGINKKEEETEYSTIEKKYENAAPIEEPVLKEESITVVPAGRPYELSKDKVTTTEKEKSENTEYHIIQTGETLYAISRKYGMTARELAELNQLELKENLKPGQKLLVLKSSFQDFEQKKSENNKEVTNSYITHKVSLGETMYNIARKYDVTINQIMEWNSKNDFSVRVGEEILIKKIN